MRKIYVSALLFVIGFTCIFGRVYGQLTDPQISSLPFSFNGFTGTEFPVYLTIGHFSGTNAGTLITTDFTSSPFYGSAANRWRDEGVNGISFQGNNQFNSGDFKVIANTTGLDNIIVSWTARTIINNVNTNILELQWRSGSGPWNNVTGDTYTSGGGPSTFTVMLPAAANNLPALQIRWIIWETGTGQRDRIAIDDIIVKNCITPSTPVVAPATAAICAGMQVLTAGSTEMLTTAILSEDFNSVASSGGTTTFPAGWVATNMSTGGATAQARWREHNSGFTYTTTFGDEVDFYSNDYSRYVISNSDDQSSPSGVTTTSLRSPAFSTVNYSSVSINFFQAFLYNSGEQAVVQASLDGMTWTNLKTYTADEGTLTDDIFYYTQTFAGDNIALPAAFINKPLVYIRFKYDATDDYWWAIDNVKVFGIAPAPSKISWTVSPAVGAGLPAAAGTPSTANSSITITPTVAGTYVYTATATATAGCTSVSATSTITVKPNNTWLGINTDWNDAQNWCPGVPTAATDVTIPDLGASGNYPIIPSASSATCHNINIATSNAYVRVTGTGLFKLTGTLTAANNFDLVDGKLELNGTALQTISGSQMKNKSIKDLLISNTSQLSITTNDTLKLTGFLSFGAAGKNFNTNNNLTLVSNAAGTASIKDIFTTVSGSPTTPGTSVSGQVNVERYLSAQRKWRFMAVNTNTTQSVNAAWMEGETPGSHNVALTGRGVWITGQAAGTPDFDGASNGSTLKYWNLGGTSYTAIPNVTYPLNSADARGAYMLFVRGDRSAQTLSATPTETTIRTKGTIFTGTQNLGKVLAQNNPKAFANIYPSAVDLKQVIGPLTTAGTTINLMVWDPQLSGSQGVGNFQYLTTAAGGDFTISPGGGSYPPGGSIVDTLESGQAFFVQGAQNGDIDIEFNEAAKTAGKRLVSRQANLIAELFGRISMRDGAENPLLDGFRVLFDNNYSSNADFDDARKLPNTNENLSVKTQNVLLAVERRADPVNDDTVRINTGSLRSKNYRFEFEFSGMAQPGRTAFLIDKITGSTIVLNLTGLNTYDFTAVAGAASAAADRFCIIFKQTGVVPVTISRLSATRKTDGSVEVKWNSENEINIDHYTVNRGASGTAFSDIMNRNPANNNGGSAAYSFVDNSPLRSDIYYRITAVGANGELKYSNVAKVNSLIKQPSIFVSPNPVRDNIIHLKINDQPASRYTVSIINSNGQILYHTNIDVTTSIFSKDLLLPDGLSGKVTLIVQNSTGEQQAVGVMVK